MSRHSRLHQAIAAAALALVATAGHGSDRARAMEIVQGKCFICHGMDGESSSPVFPRLAGQHAAYIDAPAGRLQERPAQQHDDAADGRRSGPADFKALGEYFASASDPHAQDRRHGTGAGRAASSTTVAIPTPASPPAPAVTAPTATAPPRCRVWPASTRTTPRTSSRLQQARAHQRQRDHAHHRQQAHRTRAQGGRRLHRGTALTQGRTAP